MCGFNVNRIQQRWCNIYIRKLLLLILCLLWFKNSLLLVQCDRNVTTEIIELAVDNPKAISMTTAPTTIISNRNIEFRPLQSNVSIKEGKHQTIPINDETTRKSSYNSIDNNKKRNQQIKLIKDSEKLHHSQEQHLIKLLNSNIIKLNLYDKSNLTLKATQTIHVKYNFHAIISNHPDNQGKQQQYDQQLQHTKPSKTIEFNSKLLINQQINRLPANQFNQIPPSHHTKKPYFNVSIKRLNAIKLMPQNNDQNISKTINSVPIKLNNEHKYLITLNEVYSDISHHISQNPYSSNSNRNNTNTNINNKQIHNKPYSHYNTNNNNTININNNDNNKIKKNKKFVNKYGVDVEKITSRPANEKLLQFNGDRFDQKFGSSQHRRTQRDEYRLPTNDDDGETDNFNGPTREIIYFAERGDLLNHHHLLEFSIMGKTNLNKMNNQSCAEKMHQLKGSSKLNGNNILDVDVDGNKNVEYIYKQSRRWQKRKRRRRRNSQNSNRTNKVNSQINAEKISTHQTNINIDLRVRSAFLWINVKSINRKNHHRKPDRFAYRHENLTAEPYERRMKDEFTLWVFRIIETECDQNWKENMELSPQIEISATKNIYLSELGWQKLDITSTVRQWHASSTRSRLRLLIDCSGCDDRVNIHLFDDQSSENFNKAEPKYFNSNGLMVNNIKSYDKNNKNNNDNNNNNNNNNKNDTNYASLNLNKINLNKLNHNHLTPKTSSLSLPRLSSFHSSSPPLPSTSLFSTIHESLLPKLINNANINYDAKNPSRPFLMIYTDPYRMKRVRRRALECSVAVRGQCCKEKFYVDFNELGWQDWIIAPSGYYANYCQGGCDSSRTPDTFRSYHTHVMEEYRKLDYLKGLQPCCMPVKFSSVSLIYYEEDQKIIKRELPKMVVEECGCP